MVFTMASFVSGWTNYALSLAGVTGIIVAIGVTVDSYIVFFERIKDELRNGRTIKNAAPRSFKMTWRTIWSADVVSLIGALILFWLSVGSVRGLRPLPRLDDRSVTCSSATSSRGPPCCCSHRASS